MNSCKSDIYTILLQTSCLPDLLPLPNCDAVCHTAWRCVYGISERSWRRFFASDLSSRCHEPRLSPSKNDAFIWLHAFSEGSGEPSPTNDAIHLPSWMTKKHVYSLYVQDMIEKEQRHFSKVRCRLQCSHNTLHMHVVTILQCCSQHFTHCGGTISSMCKFLLNRGSQSVTFVVL